MEGGDRGRRFRRRREVRGEMVGEDVRTDSGEDGGSDKSEEEESIVTCDFDQNSKQNEILNKIATMGRGNNNRKDKGMGLG